MGHGALADIWLCAHWGVVSVALREQLHWLCGEAVLLRLGNRRLLRPLCRRPLLVWLLPLKGFLKHPLRRGVLSGFELTDLLRIPTQHHSRLVE